MAVAVTPSGSDRRRSQDPPRLLRRGIRLEVTTLAWNVVGVFVVFAAAFAAGSVALASFGLDSAIEILASTVVIWHLTDTAAGRERPALLVLGWAFAGLAVYVTAQAIYTFAAGSEPNGSPLGIAWTGATFVAMVALATAKGATGRALGNRVLLTESRVTRIDAYLAGAVLLGLLANGVLGWWWADPLAGLVVVFYALREARAAFAEASR
ncbi:MAG TPA: cation transporter [Solirubrobacterales bacterium]|nr:cation transporter [Solirubrobacterales bacterium]